MEGLQKLRKQLDAIDDELVSLLNRRAETALQVREAKRKDQLQVYAPDREREIIERVSAQAGAFPAGPLQRIFINILSATRSLVGDLRVTYVTPECSLTHTAALKQFGEHVEYVSALSLEEVFARVERGDASCGVVPARTSFAGLVPKTFDLLLQSSLRIVAEVEVIEHLAVFSSGDRLAAITKLYGDASHLERTRDWVQAHLGHAECIAHTDATSAYAKHQSDPSVALLALDSYTDHSELRPLASGIEADAGAAARCIVVGDLQPARTGRDKTSLLVMLQDRPGALRDMLQPFSTHGVTLLKIESRSVRERDSEFMFFVDIAGHQADEAVKNAIAELTPMCSFLKTLGSYPLVCQS